MKIPAVMIYSRKTKLMFWATFKMDISPHQSNKHKCCFSLPFYHRFKPWRATKNGKIHIETHRHALHTGFISWYYIWFTQKPTTPLEWQWSRYVPSSETSGVKWLPLSLFLSVSVCFSANSIHINAIRGSLRYIFRDECKINLLLFTKWYLLKKKRFCACVCARESESER